MIKSKIGLTVVVLVFTCNSNAQAEGWMDFFKSAIDVTTESGGTEIAKSALSNSDAVSALKEALANGVESAIKTLGQPGGFSGNKMVEIAVPDSLKTIASAARTIGQGQYVDSFETTMNQAAEKAVPEAAEILADAIRMMSIDDAMNIVNGPDDSATQYFRKVSEASLSQRFKPIVNQATDQVGVTAAYKKLAGQATPLIDAFMGNTSLDLNEYVTSKSLDGLFKYIAMEEKRIRNNPVARTTDILQKVFGK
ncbi:MAG: DUF4197 domain-containing protein [Methylococcaceae bacterium]|nr:DUF4197 domain-containing protein [Methylococcaceae bacterium]